MLGFVFNAASALTTAFSCLWGERRGSFISGVLRNILGIPVWALGFLMAVRAPSLRLFGRTMLAQASGMLLLAAGGVIIITALFAIRGRAAVPSTTDRLVRSGPYSGIRHPIHAGTFLEIAGIFLLHPTRAVGIACVLGIIWMLVQTRLEEHDLLRRLPAYREYMTRVPRFLPRLSRK